MIIRNWRPLLALSLFALGMGGFIFALIIWTIPARAGEVQCGLKASWYGNQHHGRKTASGAVFDQWGISAAHMTAPFGTKFRVTYGGKSVVVTVTDRGNFARYGRAIDLSRGAFRKLADEDVGVLPVCLERLN